MLGIAGFILTVAILVVIHEWGHYIVARLAGVKILAFSFGFGPILWRRTDRRGCEWRLSLWPLGGYVKMLDGTMKTPVLQEVDGCTEEDLANSFEKKPVWARFAVVLAGPMMNLILAVLIYAGLAMAGTYELSARLGAPQANTQAAGVGVTAGDVVSAVGTQHVATRNELRFELSGWMGRDSVPVTLRDEAGAQRTVHFDLSRFRGETTEDPLDYLGLTPALKGVAVAGVQPQSAASEAGLTRGDEILAIDGVSVVDVKALIERIQARSGERVALEVKHHSGEIETLMVQVRPVSVTGGTVGRIGASLGGVADVVYTREGPVAAIATGCERVWNTIRVTAKSVAGMITGEVSLKGLAGPVAIGDMAGQTLAFGIVPYLLFLAMVSISIGILNLLPVPVLDGGHLMFFLYEMATGRRPSERVFDWGQRMGLVLLLALMVLALGNDMVRLFGLN